MKLRSRSLVALAWCALAASVVGCLPQPVATDCPTTASCSTCLGHSGCGFCATTAQCMPGTSIGPLAGNFCAGAGAWSFASCTSGVTAYGDAAAAADAPQFDASQPSAPLGSAPAISITCTAGRYMQVGCNARCGLGSCAGDPVLRACDGSGDIAACQSGSTLILEDDDSTCGGASSLCPVLTVQCPPSGVLLFVTRSFGSAASYTCNLAVRF